MNWTSRATLQTFCLALVTTAVASLSSCATGQDTAHRSSPSAPRFIEFTDFTRFERSAESRDGITILESRWLKTPLAWDELVISWNAIVPSGSGLRFEARAMTSKGPTKFYQLGAWAETTNSQPRESILRQKDGNGDVMTDTLVLQQPSGQVQLRITLVSGHARTPPKLKRVGLSFANRSFRPEPRPPNTLAWGRTLDVPEKSQLSYAGGRDWCSPTSVSMVLNYWSRRLGRPELNVDVPELAAGVHDPNWPGTGNWPFNTAFAGRFDGMRAVVTRLNDISELESLVAAGVPPIVSVSYPALYGRKNDQGNGHLVVLVGFTATGDPIVNDPWADFKKGDTVRVTVKRENLVKAWAHSRRTVYLIHPEPVKLPTQREQRW